MALKYYPLSRIIPNKYTRGNEFTLSDGSPYAGKYYITYNNKFFTGINPVLSTGKELFLISNTKAKNIPANSIPNPLNRSKINTTAQQIFDTATKQFTGPLSEISPYFPVPIPSDYARGYFTRYFAKNIVGPGFILEISKQDWSQIQDGGVDKGVLAYETVDMLWQLTGPLYDTRKSQYQILGGVYTTNKRVTEVKQKSFRGIEEFIGGEYTKFARITPDSVATSGSM
jgi:hypothetical protein